MAEPLIDRDELTKWLRSNAPDPSDIEMSDFLDVVVAAAEITVRAAGAETWTVLTAPPRARLIALLLAKNYFENPDQLISESVGPLSERRVDDVVRGMRLTEEEQAELARLAGLEPLSDGGAGRLWTLGSTDQGVAPQKDIYVSAGQPRSDWLFPLYAIDDPVIQNWDIVTGETTP